MPYDTPYGDDDDEYCKINTITSLSNIIHTKSAQR